LDPALNQLRVILFYEKRELLTNDEIFFLPITSRLQKDEKISSLSIELPCQLLYPDFINLKKQIFTTKQSISPCQMKCDECSYYEKDLCLGCPATMHYKGSLFGELKF